MSAATDSTLSRGAHEGAEALLREAPHLLLPYQQAWVADRSPLKVCEKSRRIGLSWAEAADCALHAASEGGSDVYYMSYEKDMTRQFIEDCGWWAKWYGLAAGEMYEDVWIDGDDEIQVFRIDFASGHHIQAVSSAPRNLRSKQGRAVFDEYAFTDPAKQPELLKAALAFLIWGGDVRVISTHNGVENGFHQLIEEIRSGRRPGSVHRTTFREAVEQGLYKRICLVKKKPWSKEAEAAWVEETYAFYGDSAAEELDAIPSKSGGKYFSRVLVEDRMDASAPVLRLALDDAFAQKPEYLRVAEIQHWCETYLKPLLELLDPDLKSVLGEDFGRSADLTFILPAQITPQLVRRCPFAVELRNVPFEAQRQIVFYIIDRLPRFVAAAFDARGNGSYLAEVAMQRYGATRIHQVMATAAWYLENFPRYRSAIAHAETVLPKDADLLDDHSDVELVGGIPKVPDGKRRKGTDGQYRHADGAIAAVMMWFASLNQGAPIEFQASGARSSEAMLAAYTHRPGGYDAIAAERGYGVVRSLLPLTGYR